MIERINYAIDKIGQRTIFDVDYPLLDSLDLAMQRRPSVTSGWLNEFSQLGLECLRESSIRKSLYQQKQRSNKTPSDMISVRSHAPSMSTVLDHIQQFEETLANACEINFNTHEVFEKIGRKNALSVMTVHIMQKLGLDKIPQINQSILTRFLNRVYKGYIRDV